MEQIPGATFQGVGLQSTTFVKLKEIIYPYVVFDSCENFGLSDLVKFSTCAILWHTWYALVVAISDLITSVCCLQFHQLLARGKFKMASKMTTSNKNSPLN